MRAGCPGQIARAHGSGRLLSRLRLPAQQVISGALGMGGSAENGALVLLEHGQPVGEVGGVVLSRISGVMSSCAHRKAAPNSATSSSKA